MRNVLILTFILISVSCLGQVPTDWQLMNLKGKVKSLKVYAYSDGLEILGGINRGVYTDYCFDNKGYIQSVKAYTIGASTGREFIHRSLVYGAYENQKREIKGLGGFTNRDYHEVQEWSSPTEYRNTIYTVFPKNDTITILVRCDTEGRLIYKTNKTQEPKWGVMDSEEVYEYSEEGQVVCIAVTTNDLFVRYTEVVVGSLDAMGNPTKAVYNHPDGNKTIITYTYEYYE